MFNMIQATHEKDLFEIYKLRAKVWYMENKEPPADTNKFWKACKTNNELQWMIPDQPDNALRSINLCIKENDKVVSAGKVSIYRSINDVSELLDVYGDEVFKDKSAYHPVAFLSRLIVHPDYREKGLAKQINQERIRCAKINECQLICSSATEKNKLILEKMGFKKHLPSVTKYFEQNNGIQTVVLMSKLI